LKNEHEDLFVLSGIGYLVCKIEKYLILGYYLFS